MRRRAVESIPRSSKTRRYAVSASFFLSRFHRLLVEAGAEIVDEGPLDEGLAGGGDGVFGVRIQVEADSLAVLAVARLMEGTSEF